MFPKMKAKSSYRSTQVYSANFASFQNVSLSKVVDSQTASWDLEENGEAWHKHILAGMLIQLAEHTYMYKTCTYVYIYI